MEHLWAQFQDPQLCQSLVRDLQARLGKGFRFMEVCGTHTVSMFQSGLRSLLPEGLTHLSGPGCPVCVTHEREVAAFLELAQRPGVVLATFGDLLRVPGPEGRSLKAAQAEGAQIEVVYSPFDALQLAQDRPESSVVFLGIGFETTAPTVAATIYRAKQLGVGNLSVLSLHKLVPPALNALLEDRECAVDGFLLPGHVSAVIGLEPYAFVAQTYATPGAVAGFEPVDILAGLRELLRQRDAAKPQIVNVYTRAVAEQGNPKAVALMEKVFAPCDTLWRGLGELPASGLEIRPEFAAYDAREVLDVQWPEVAPLPGCRCGEILKGQLAPDQCPVFGTRCTPANPVGPCMVSTEGSCAAYYKYAL